jgi:hypothetical protein
VAVEHREERQCGEQEREGEIPDHDIRLPPQVRDPPEIDHWERLVR